MKRTTFTPIVFLVVLILLIIATICNHYIYISIDVYIIIRSVLWGCYGLYAILFVIYMYKEGASLLKQKRIARAERLKKEEEEWQRFLQAKEEVRQRVLQAAAEEEEEERQRVLQAEEEEQVLLQKCDAFVQQQKMGVATSLDEYNITQEEFQQYIAIRNKQTQKHIKTLNLLNEKIVGLMVVSIAKGLSIIGIIISVFVCFFSFGGPAIGIAYAVAVLIGCVYYTVILSVIEQTAEKLQMLISFLAESYNNREN